MTDKRPEEKGKSAPVNPTDKEPKSEQGKDPKKSPDQKHGTPDAFVGTHQIGGTRDE